MHPPLLPSFVDPHSFRSARHQQVLEKREMNAGDELITEGDAGHDFWMLESGEGKAAAHAPKRSQCGPCRPLSHPHFHVARCPPEETIGCRTPAKKKFAIEERCIPVRLFDRKETIDATCKYDHHDEQALGAPGLPGDRASLQTGTVSHNTSNKPTRKQLCAVGVKLAGLRIFAWY